MTRVEDTSIQLCRLCLMNTSGCVSMFPDVIDPEDNELPNIVKNCVGVEVHRGDGLTCMVCGPCHKMVRKFNDFKSTCLESQWRLKNMPRWAANGPRDPLEGTEEVDVGGERAESGTLGMKEVIMDETSAPNSDQSDESNKKSEKIWPVAVWTVSEGCWRANTCTSEETVISDLMDDSDNSVLPVNEAIDEEEEVEGRTTPTSEDRVSLICRPIRSLPTPYHVDHTYSTRPKEPVQLCSIVMEADDEDETTESPATEDGEGTLSNSAQSNDGIPVSVWIGDKEVGFVKEFGEDSDIAFKELAQPIPATKSRSVLKAINGKVMSLTVSQQKSSNEKVLIAKSNSSKGIVKGRVVAAKLSNGKLIVNNGSKNFQKIIIKGGHYIEKKGKHIPQIKGLRLTSDLMIPRDSMCSILKIKKIKR